MKSAINSLLALGMFAIAVTSRAETYTYIVGICDYPTPLDAKGQPLKDEKGAVIDNDLKGCVNDGNAITALLTTKYSAKEANIRKSYDKDASGKNFIENIRWLVSTPKAGDNVIFYFSGHGAQVEDPKAKEPDPNDKINESIVLADGTLVIDDLFDEVKTILVTKGVNATFVFDSCFSGGMSRDFMVNGRPAKEKFLPKTKLGKNYPEMSRAMMNAARPQLGPSSLKSQDANAGTFASIYASKETEPSVDLGGTADSPAHGLFTLLLTAVLTEEPKSPAEDLVDAINEFATSKGFKQGPNTEFSSPSRASQPVFPGA